MEEADSEDEEKEKEMSRLYSKIGFAQYIRFLELQEEAEMKVRLKRNFRFSDEQVMERILKIKERKGNELFSL